MARDRPLAAHDNVSVHPSADVAGNATIGAGTRIWHQAQVRENARIGAECIIGKGAYVDIDVVIGNRCKLQNSAFVYHGARLEDGVFLGPGAMLLNDLRPRAITSDGALKGDADWAVSGVTVGRGASVGGGAVILPGVTVGRFALVGAGAVVTTDVPDHGLVFGNPAVLRGFVCTCAARLERQSESAERCLMKCAECGREESIPMADYRRSVSHRDSEAKTR